MQSTRFRALEKSQGHVSKNAGIVELWHLYATYSQRRTIEPRRRRRESRVIGSRAMT